MVSQRETAYRPSMSVHTRSVGDHLKDWRQRRRLSQLDLATEARISARHLSFVETGRSAPSREMIMHLAEQLQIPRRERNVLLVAAGYAPIFPERSLDDPALSVVREAIDIVLQGHKPYPAFAIDRRWNIIGSNHALPILYEGVAAELLVPPINGLRLSLHPEGLAPSIANLAEWRAHLLHRLRQQIELTADPELVELQREVSEYPNAPAPDRAHSPPHDWVVVPWRIRTRMGVLSFISTTMVFGTPVDITLSELAIEAFFPADHETIAIVRALSA
jgi:transcriptional regulator with XRE-family HTH domain